MVRCRLFVLMGVFALVLAYLAEYSPQGRKDENIPFFPRPVLSQKSQKRGDEHIPAWADLLKIDSHKDSLPPGAIGRIGTQRLRHMGEVFSVAFAPDGKSLASVGSDETVRIWAMPTGRELRCLRGHKNYVTSLAFSPDGKTLASAGREGTIILWDAASGAQLDCFRKDGQEVGSLAFSPDGKILASGGRASVLIWDVAAGKLMRTLEGNYSGVRSLAFSSNGQILGILSNNGLHLCTSAAAREPRVIKNPPGPEVRTESGEWVLQNPTFSAFAFASDGRTLATTGGSGPRIWDVSTGKVIQILSHENNFLPGCVAVSPDGKTLAAGGYFNQLCLWDLTTGKVTRPRLRGYYASIRSVTFSPDGKLLATGGEDGLVRLWDMVTGKQLETGGKERGSLRICLSPDGKTLATFGGESNIQDDTICLWELATGKLLRQLQHQYAWASAMAFTPDGRILAAGTGWTETIHLWEVSTGKLLRRWELPREVPTFLAFAPDGKTLAEGCWNGVRLWDVQTGQEICRIGDDRDGALAGTYSPDGRTLVTGGSGASLRVWDLATGEELHRLVGHGGGSEVCQVCFSSDGTILASAARDGMVCLWETTTYRRLHRFARKTTWRSVLAISPNGTVLATEGDGNNLCLWDVATGQEHRQVIGHQGPVYSAAFSPDGKTLISGSEDGTALVWNLQAVLKVEPPRQEPLPPADHYGDPLPPGTVARMGSLRFQHGSGIASVTFSPDAKTLAVAAAGNEGSSVCLWDVATGQELRRFDGYGSSWPSQIGFSPDGALLAALTGHEIYLWETGSGKKRGKVVQHKDSINSFSFSPDGKILAAAGGYPNGYKDFAVYLWNIETGEELLRLVGHMTPVRKVLFSANGKRILSSSSEEQAIPGAICLWDATTGKMLRQWKKGTNFAIFSPDGNTLAYPENDQEICLWDALGEKVICRLAVPKASCTFSPDSGVLATSSEEQPIRLWAVATGREVRAFPGQHSKDTHVSCFSPDGMLLASISKTNIIRLWNVATGEEVRPFGGHREAVSCLAFSPDGKTLTSASSDRTIRIWETETGRELRVVGGPPGEIIAMAFSPDARTLASANDKDTVCLWEAATGKELRRFQEPPIKKQDQDWRDVRTLTFSSDGTLLVSGRRDGIIYLWDPGTGKEVRKLEIQGAPLSSVAVSPDGKTVAAGVDGSFSSLATVHLWQTSTGNELSPLRLEKPKPDGVHRLNSFNLDRGMMIGAMAFSADGKILATSESRLGRSGEYGQAIRLWEVATGGELLKLDQGNGTSVMVLSPDGKYLLTGPDAGRFWFWWGVFGKFCLWDLAEGKPLGWLEGHLAPVNCLIYSADGRRLATGSMDRTLLVWDAGWPNIRKRVQSAAPVHPELKEHWANLTGPDAARAYASAWRLAAFPGQTVPILREHLKPVMDVDTRRIAQMIADLDSEHYAVRVKARQWLQQHDEVAETALREVLRTVPTLEVRRQVDDLLRDFENKAPPRERLLAIRGTAVLECIGSSEARQVLDTLARGASEARLTREARASLERLARRPEPAR